MITHEKLLPCPFCGGEAHLFDGYWVECTKCGCQTPETFEEVAIAAWNRRTPPAAVPEPWGWLCNGKGDGWEERDKVVRDPKLIARYRERPDLWRIEPLYLGSQPAAVPDGWVMVPKEPTPEMLFAATSPESYWIGHPEAPPESIERWRQCHRADAARKYRSMISAAPAAPTDGGNEMNLEAVAVVHIKEDGDTDYLICGDDKFRLFIVDERAPNDRVYEITLRAAPETIREIIGDSPIGHRNDERHAAIEARIKEELDGTPRLKVVEGKRVLAEAEGEQND